jgi:Protein of unknown function (DUF3352)
LGVRRIVLAAAGAALLLAAAGCGGGDGDVGSGADAAPRSTAVFVSIDTDFDGDEWQAAEDLVAKFPDGRDALRDLSRELQDEDVNFERDVKPAVGPEVDLVLLDLEDEDAFVVLTQPDDEAKWRELVRKGDEPGVTEEIDGGWWAAAESQETLDRFKEARGEDSLASSDAFEDAMGELPEDAVAKAFMNGETLTAALRKDPETTPEERQMLECFLGEGEIPSMAFAVGAEDDGVRGSGAVLTERGDDVENGASRFADELPAEALFFWSARDIGRQVRDILRCASDADEEFARQLAQAELGLGLSLEEDILPLFDGETAYALYRPAESELAQDTGGVTFPTITIATEVEDEARAREVADRLAQRASMFVDGVEVADADVGGIAAKRVTLPDAGGASVLYAVFDGKLVLTSTEAGLLAFREEGPRLSDDEAYQGARDAAGAPDEAAGFGYANVTALVDVFLSYVEGMPGGPPPDTREAVEPLRSLFLWTESGDGKATFEGFLRIE